MFCARVDDNFGAYAANFACYFIFIVLVTNAKYVFIIVACVDILYGITVTFSLWSLFLRFAWLMGFLEIRVGLFLCTAFAAEVVHAATLVASLAFGRTFFVGGFVPTESAATAFRFEWSLLFI